MQDNRYTLHKVHNALYSLDRHGSPSERKLLAYVRDNDLGNNKRVKRSSRKAIVLDGDEITKIIEGMDLAVRARDVLDALAN